MTPALEGKIAVVTGAASGIGLATTEALLKAGAMVVMVDRNEKALKNVVAKLGERAVPHVTDLLSVKSCAAMIPQILDKVGAIDILFCNAGAYLSGNVTEISAEAIDPMLQLNVNAVIKNVHAVLPHMAARRSGDIVVTCSVAGHAAMTHEPVYSASKWAINCFTQALRRQVNHQGIRVSQVSPGPVNTALLAGWPADRLQAVKDADAVIEPSEVADAVLYMLTRPRNVTVRDMIILPTNVDA